VHYAALGHLHGCQTLAPHLRYSGSPLAYSFSEETHRKSMWLVDLAADGSVTAERTYCPQPRPLACLRGTLEELLTDGRFAPHEQSWVQATLTDRARPAEPMERLRRRFPHALQLLFDPEDPEADAPQSYAARVSGRSDLEIAEGFLRHVRQGVEPAAEELDWLRDGFERIRETADRRAELPR
jgi:exonuclease SbcD